TRDNVRVALKDLPAGSTIEDNGRVLQLVEAVRHKHKFALVDLEEGDTVIMYGVTVGRASRPIRAGEMIRTDNLEHSTDNGAAVQRQQAWQAPDVSAFQG